MASSDRAERSQTMNTVMSFWLEPSGVFPGPPAFEFSYCCLSNTCTLLRCLIAFLRITTLLLKETAFLGGRVPTNNGGQIIWSICFRQGGGAPLRIIILCLDNNTNG